ncbi:9149_t:CDS:2 [Gigaspora margarita]|uniref:9149_t:CDS:1 n=1 Tax=Gigaspora margarita TaxID=4874 RepID=A0ABM8VZ07_GIGMA|nr:9149_t:CDS:2 [Gigaspora margarita]
MECYQFCIDFKQLENKFLFTNVYFEDAKQFSIKYFDLLKIKFEKMDYISTIRLINIAFEVRKKLHLQIEEAIEEDYDDNLKKIFLSIKKEESEKYFDYSDAQKFNNKYAETLKLITNYNYSKMKNIDSEEKIIQLLSFTSTIKKFLHQDMYTIFEEEGNKE